MERMSESAVDRFRNTEGSIYIYCLLSSMAHHPIDHTIFVGLYYGPIWTTTVNSENPCNGSMIHFPVRANQASPAQRYRGTLTMYVSNRKLPSGRFSGWIKTRDLQTSAYKRC